MRNTWDNRGSGRTTRMLEYVVKCAAETTKGRYMFVFCHSQQRARELQIHCAKQCDGKIAGTKVYPPEGGEINFAATTEAGWDWQHMRPIGAHPSCKIVVDHYALQRFAEEFHRFDKPGTA